MAPAPRKGRGRVFGCGLFAALLPLLLHVLVISDTAAGGRDLYGILGALCEPVWQTSLSRLLSHCHARGRTGPGGGDSGVRLAALLGTHCRTRTTACATHRRIAAGLVASSAEPAGWQANAARRPCSAVPPPRGASG